MSEVKTKATNSKISVEAKAPVSSRVQDAIDHLASRIEQKTGSKTQSWTLADVEAATTVLDASTISFGAGELVEINTDRYRGSVTILDAWPPDRSKEAVRCRMSNGRIRALPVADLRKIK